ncbi:hypothetical protein M5K25_009426 [Dendrobium thyrsiflorum]|uniref:S-acyltransferase n=1 Tax=Dendrobium thyrsiflorum TaxID=117978 RepID=A0ABD0VCH8_DENTH
MAVAGSQFPGVGNNSIFLTLYCFLCLLRSILGKKLYEFVAVAVYSIFVFFVIILYIRCASIDPADFGIMITGDGASACKSQRGRGPRDTDQIDLSLELKPGKKKAITCTDIGCCFCSLMAKEDCHNNLDTKQQQPTNDEGLFCLLCNAKVGMLSKHCRSCDKCVDEFDHHCHWLNNCIGRKNYVTFLFLMATSLVWATVQCGVGIAVLVRCFVNKRAIQNEVIDRLGDVFSRVHLTIFVAICTALTLIAMAPLGELFFFHMILIRKGITTYDYVIAVRTQREPPVNEQHSLQSSPFSSAPTAISGAPGLQYKGAWCTPPQITANNSDNIKPHLEILSYVDPDVLEPSESVKRAMKLDPDALEPSESVKRAMKPPVRISAWKLMKLDSNEAMRSAAKARASSSVLKPINSRMEQDTDHVRSSRNTSGINSYAGTPTSLPLKGSCPPSRASMEDQEMCPNTPTALSSSPVKKAQQHLTTKYFNPIFQSSMNRSDCPNIASDGENGMLSSGGLSPAAAITSSSVY